MKKIITFSVIYLAIFGNISSAQPIITNSNALPAVGTVDTIYISPATVVPGGGGAGITWNFSALTLTNGGTITISDPATTSYAATFPTSNFCLKITAGPTAYDYDRKTSTGMETIATGYMGTGTGQNYSTNPRLSIPFPFHYTDAVIDTFQTTTGIPEFQTLTYDGYGTLITPLHTYTNVIRVKEDYGGTDFHYAWYTVNPLILVLNYSNTANNYIYISNMPSVTGLNQANTIKTSVKLYPNPFTDNATLKIDAPNGLCNATITITDATGRTIKQVPVYTAETVIQRDGLSAGLYFYCVQNDGVKVANGKLVIN